MITLDLIEYIKLQISKNVSKDLIISRLSQAGWCMEDIEEGFLNVESSTPKVAPVESSPVVESVIENPQPEISIKDEPKEENKEVKPIIDQYRELPEIANPDTEVSDIISPIRVDQQKVWVPTSIKPKMSEEIQPRTDMESYKLEFSKIEIPKVENQAIEPIKIEISPVEKTEVPTIEPIKIETPKVELPMVEPVQAELLREEIKAQDTITAPQELIPNISKPTPPKLMSDILPKNAMLSSYSQDILSVSKENETAMVSKKLSLWKWIIIFVVVCIIGGTVFAFIEGYLKIPGSKFSFSVVKKDPKTIILNAASNISKLQSYKTETDISISSPSLSNITTGLSSGEAVTSNDRDSVSVKAKGLTNHIDGRLIFDYLLDFKSSLLKEDMNSNLKYDGSNLSVMIPDLSQIINKDAPTPTTVSVTPGQLGLIIPEFSPYVQSLIKKIDVYEILSKDVPLYVKNETASIFKEFVGGLEYTEKEQENIRGVDTYHYEMIASRPVTKKLLSSLVDLFLTQLSPDQRKNLDEALGSSSISAFEVWIGKNDDNIYQFKFTLNMPLSKVLGLNDSGIADNEVKLDWVTSYYDLDVPNNISMSNNQINMEGFVKSIKDKKIKNTISAFGSQATSFRNATGAYGKKSNSTGSCISPALSSLFSPLGHAKGADTAVGAIASSMNSLMSSTNGASLCYSTPSTWALAAPLSTSTPVDTTLVASEVPANNSSFYCADSTGVITTLSSPIKGAVCK